MPVDPARLTHAQQLLKANRIDEASSMFATFVREDANCGAAWLGLGQIARRLKQPTKAVELLLQAVRVTTDAGPCFAELGHAMTETGNFAGAIMAFESGLKRQPNDLGILIGLGDACLKAGRPDDAERHLKLAIKAHPKHVAAHHALGSFYNQQLKFDLADAQLREAVRLSPKIAQVHLALSTAQMGLKDHRTALQTIQQALKLDPKSPEIWFAQGNVYRMLYQTGASMESFERTLQLNPQHVGALTNLGNALKDQGRIPEALEHYRAATALQPEHLPSLENVLSTLHYNPDCDLAELHREHTHWDQRFGIPFRAMWKPFDYVLDSERPLRIGLYSNNLGNHPVGHFVRAAFEELDRDQFEIVVYSSRLTLDAERDRFRSMAREWHEVAMLNDDQLAQRIREDRIDILIDLAGRLAGGRPLLLARKPAPILINWIGYTGSLGLSAVDYIIADQHHIPPEAEPFYSEKVLRLRDGHMCFAPPDEAPEVVPPPVLQRGYITLGSFNNPGKVNAQVVEVWAQMLREIPNSKLLLKYRNFDDVATKAHFESQFQRHGIEPSRLMFEGVSPYREMLARYGDVDIALDPFPFTGGMTTCLALWMGCPVVTWPRDTFASRQSLSYLSVIGLPQLIAQSRDEYVQKVVDLSRDVSELESLRREIRPQMASSPFCDRGRFTRDLETKWRAIWRDWVSTEKSEA